MKNKINKPKGYQLPIVFRWGLDKDWNWLYELEVANKKWSYYDTRTYETFKMPSVIEGQMMIAYIQQCHLKKDLYVQPKTIKEAEKQMEDEKKKKKK